MISPLSLLPCSAAVEAPAAPDSGGAGEPRDHAAPSILRFDPFVTLQLLALAKCYTETVRPSCSTGS
ncbi:hypothetical protein J1605_020442 [Eschrichtius robustus]|uniref:Secreted protein n=1 Tax=Eschrichtius robustus TaxID=9764 RepID=A0AB34HLG3_ESCRO|nr:hypothetical protein J1605_020442 [Eschrichtius robustus]